MADRRIEAVCAICGIALRASVVIFVSDDSTEAQAIELVQSALVIGNFLEIVAAFVSRFGPAPVIWLEYQPNANAESIVLGK